MVLLLYSTSNLLLTFLTIFLKFCFLSQALPWKICLDHAASVIAHNHSGPICTYMIARLSFNTCIGIRLVTCVVRVISYTCVQNLSYIVYQCVYLALFACRYAINSIFFFCCSPIHADISGTKDNAINFCTFKFILIKRTSFILPLDLHVLIVRFIYFQ